MGRYDDLVFKIPQEFHNWYGFASPRGFFRGTTMMEKAHVYMDFTAVTKPLPMEVPHTHIHLIPLQKESDMLFSNPKLSFTPEEFAEIAANIQAAL